MKAIRIVVKGKVQGVFFRASALTEARRYAICGTVENTNSGEVKIIAEGKAENLEQFLHWCRKGPRMAVVSSVISEDIELVGYKNFSILKA